MRFGLLGRLDVLTGTGVAVRPPGALPRAIVARLLLGRGAVVQRDVIIDELWWERETKDPVNALQVQVTKLRSAFAAAGEPDRFVSGHGGYRLVLADADELDTVLFEDALREGRDHLRAQRYDAAEQRLRAGLSRWRGRALDDLFGRPFDAERTRLEGLRAAAVEEAADAGLALGRAAELVPELAAAVREEPLREGVRRRYMLALYRSGRHTEALAAYEEGRKILDVELGADPSPELRSLHSSILRHDPSLRGTTSVSPATAPAPPPRRHAEGTSCAPWARSSADGTTSRRCGSGSRPGGSSRSWVPAASARPVSRWKSAACWPRDAMPCGGWTLPRPTHRAHRRASPPPSVSPTRACRPASCPTTPCTASPPSWRNGTSCWPSTTASTSSTR
ncbi:hypothetical protein Smic_77070 [Streptomyces microflavus]|uniref:OmpR/PhoB-type domain-containing protein n=1 Tax=Streptomyces microflavus TaxID=1919 RepID=A0A7J0D350_STRMI|nr:hypothetical protein Smic_77070 [Streptomyces microflavus]